MTSAMLSSIWGGGQTGERPESTVVSRARERISRLESDAERQIEEVTSLLEDMSYKHIKREVDEMANKVLRGASKVFEFAKSLADIHPVASAVISAISFAVDLEIQHQENDAHIAVVHATMAKTVFHMRFLNQIPADEEKKLSDAMKVLFSNMAKTIHRFGQFLDTYHTHQWQRTVKVLFAHFHKSKLHEFDKEFKQHRDDMDDMYKSVAHVQLTTVVCNTTAILERLNRIRDPATQDAIDFVNKHGGADAVMKNTNLVEKVASLLGEKATYSMKSILNLGLDMLLHRHAYVWYIPAGSLPQISFIFTFTGDRPVHAFKYKARETLIISPDATTLVQLKDGPHELIENPEFQKLWQDHSAIGDIIDDDGSGHITVLELNAFLTAENRRRPSWTNPGWLALYYGEIDAMMRDLQRSVEGVDLQPTDSWNTVKGILGHLKPLILVADVEDFSGIIAVPHQLRRLQEEFRQFEEQTIRDNLHYFGVHLVDKTSIMVVVGDSRIELHMMPLLYVLTQRLCKLVKKLSGQRHIHHDEVIEVEELATSYIAIFVAFDGRLRDLSRGWRFEAKNIPLQVDRYADGMFKKYYDSAPVDTMAQIADRLRALESYIAALDKKVDGLQRIEERLTPQEKRTNRLLDGLLTILCRRLWGARRVRTVPLNVPASVE
ncbi:hypothetical protein TRAPUB_13819 [Trametes pubescens]|uniref:EF-hand domain-containing protein n=1 Tax=Trametes pubescens TaxID=154538 RepID=A0A1M2VQ39_TRAPU|nr:hypothetical protein TRAPUB_13819 [Trametes pubescens]